LIELALTCAAGALISGLVVATWMLRVVKAPVLRTVRREI